jgi:hypothetical protein
MAAKTLTWKFHLSSAFKNSGRKKNLAPPQQTNLKFRGFAAHFFLLSEAQP